MKVEASHIFQTTAYGRGTRTYRVDVRLEAGVVKRCPIDVVSASHPGVLEDEEARHLHLIVVACLYGRNEAKVDKAMFQGMHARMRQEYFNTECWSRKSQTCPTEETTPDTRAT